MKIFVEFGRKSMIGQIFLGRIWSKIGDGTNFFWGHFFNVFRYFVGL